MTARISKLASVALLAAFTAAFGCAEGKRSSAASASLDSSDTKPWYGGYELTRGERRAMPEPAPQPARAEPAPAPTPVGDCNYRPTPGPGMSVASLAFPTGDTRTSAVVLHQVMPRQVRAGANYDYEIHVTNITRATLQNVVVNGESMENMSMVSSNPAAGRGAGGNVQWVLGDLGPCKTEIIRVTGRADRVGTASACLSVSYNNTLCAALEVVQPALQITKTMTTDAMRCDPITATIEVKNTGTGAAENVVIKDNLPAGLMTADGKQTVELNVGTLAGGQTATRTLNLKADRKGRFENNATATATGGLTATSNTVAVVVKQPELALAIKCPNTIFIGRQATYEFTVTNRGDGACNNTQLTATLPAGATVVSMSDGGANGTWNLGTIAPGASKTVTAVLAPQTMGANQVSARATCACAEPVTANCSTELKGIPAILVECIDLEDPDEVGTTETYVITVTNQGSAPGTGIRVVAEIPAQMSYVSSTGATTGAAAGQTVTFAPLATLAPKAKAEWRVTVRCNQPGDVRFRLRVTSDQFSTPIEETESTNLYQ